MYSVVYKTRYCTVYLLYMAQWRSKQVALTIYYFKVYEINCCVIDWHSCVFYEGWNFSSGNYLLKTDTK